MASMFPSSKNFDVQRLRRLADWMQRDVDERRLPGSSVAVSKDGVEVFFHSVGHRDIRQELPFQRDTLARIYSMTKPITSVALMMLVERGLLHLDAPVSEFIPSFYNMEALVPGATAIDQTEPCQTPTIHQLLTHTSGLSYPFNPDVLPRAMGAESISFGPDQGSLAHMVDRLAGLPLAFFPGQRWEYSVSLDVVGRVIEIVSGQSLSNFFESEIFNPLGMTETGFSVAEGQEKRFASLYTPLASDTFTYKGGNQHGVDSLRLIDHADNSPFLAASLYSGGGGLVSTIDDYLKFAEVLRKGANGEDPDIISASTLRFMMQNHLPGDISSMGPQSFAEQSFNGMGFGIGGSVVLNSAMAICPGSVGDFSWGGMASTFFWVDTIQNTSVVFFTQLSPSNVYPLRPKLKALIHGALTG